MGFDLLMSISPVTITTKTNKAEFGKYVHLGPRNFGCNTNGGFNHRFSLILQLKNPRGKYAINVFTVLNQHKKIYVTRFVQLGMSYLFVNIVPVACFAFFTVIPLTVGLFTNRPLSVQSKNNLSARVIEIGCIKR